MENNKLIEQNSNNDVSNVQTENKDGFMTSNTSGFFSSKEISSNEHNIPNSNKPQLNINQTIDQIEDAEDEFGSNNFHMNSDLQIENAIVEDIADTSTPPPTLNTHAQTEMEQLASNPSSIFNIPLISPDNNENNILPNTLENNGTTHNNSNNDVFSGNPTDNVDFFSFNFAPTMPTPTIEETSTSNESIDNMADFGFGTVIKAKETQEIIPDQSDRVELTNFLQPRENIIKKPEEVSENDNNVIRINDDTESDKYRSKNQLVKMTLYSFYILLGVLVVVFIYKIYKSNTDFALTRNEITLAINSTYQAEIISNSKVQDNKKYEWTSSNTDVVTVDENGLVTSVGGGEATITVKKSNNTKTLKVTAVDIEIESITFNEKLIKLKVGEEKTLQAIINNDETIVIDLLWESEDPTIASVDQNGRVTALSVGTVNIYVYDEISGLGGEIALEIEPADDGDKGEENKETEKPTNNKVAVTGVALNKSDTIMEVGEYIVVKAVVRPASATNKKVTWSSSNKNVATVSSNGKITATGVGTATITAKTSNGKKATIKITVTEKFVKVTSISLNKESVNLNVGESTTLSATIKPKNASNKGINWTSSDEGVATVSASGKVIAKKAGTTIITATTKDGNKKAVCTVTVKEVEIIAVTGITLDKSSLDLEVGDATTLVATVSPGDATYKDVSWETSNVDVVTVANGRVTAKGPGTATITASTNNGKKATCTVTVKDKVVTATGIKLNKTQISLNVGETYQLTATISPSDTTDKSLTWTSNKSSYASVENGLVTAHKAGTAVITVKTSNGKRTTCSVTIIDPNATTEPEPEPDTGTENTESET